MSNGVNKVVNKIKQLLGIDSKDYQNMTFSKNIHVGIMRYYQMYATVPLVAEEITDWKLFLERIKKDDKEIVKSFTNLLTPQIKKRINSWNDKEKISPEFEKDLLGDINSILSGKDFYNDTIHTGFLKEDWKQDYINDEKRYGAINTSERTNRIVFGEMFPDCFKNINDFESAYISGTKAGLELLIEKSKELYYEELSDEKPEVTINFDDLNEITENSLAGLILRVILEDEWEKNYYRQQSRPILYHDERNEDPNLYAEGIERDGKIYLQITGRDSGFDMLAVHLFVNMTKFSKFTNSFQFNGNVTDNSVQLFVQLANNKSWEEIQLTGLSPSMTDFILDP